ncbi:MAG: DsrE family protein [Pirellulaceae bacterium]|nr:DsrE family protein [Pirellulaceae bacterium]
MRFVIATLLLALMVQATAVAGDPTGQPAFEHPIIKDHGGTVVLSDAEQQPKPNSKVQLDISSAEKSGSVIMGLDRAALILNQYTQAKAGSEYGFKMALVLHGPATLAVLSHDAYAKHAKPYLKDKGQIKNANLELLKRLREAGVQIYVCGQALAHQGIDTSDVAPEVKVAVSAATVNINLQMDNFAYIPFR